jgi:hypothetical protein
VIDGIFVKAMRAAPYFCGGKIRAVVAMPRSPTERVARVVSAPKGAAGVVSSWPSYLPFEPLPEHRARARFRDSRRQNEPRQLYPAKAFPGTQASLLTVR